MNASSKRLLASVAVVLVIALGVFAWYRHWNPWPPPGGGGGGGTRVVAVTDFDAFQKSLASIVAGQFKVDPRTVVVAPASYNLGWLLDSVETYPADQTDCVPTPTPVAIPASHLFPAYQLTSDTAASMTLGSDALQQLTNASIDVSHSAELLYSIDDVKVVLMDLKTVDQVSRTGACGVYVSQHPKSRLIRGLVTGKISFKFSTSNPVSAAAKLPKLGGISTKGDPGSSIVTVADDQPSQILEIVSILQDVRSQGSSAAEVAANPHETISPLPASAKPRAISPGTPHIFLQQDVLDRPGAGAAIVRELEQSWPGANVEPRVEKILSSKMPSTAQVRFFNAGDQALAEECRTRLKAVSGVDARVVRVGLAAPMGQLEVWLAQANPDDIIDQLIEEVKTDAKNTRRQY